MIEILKGLQLRDSEYYHCFDKDTLKHEIKKAVFRNGYAFVGGLGAHEHDNRAFKNWVMFGPLKIEDKSHIAIKVEHGGLLITMDNCSCISCLREKK